MKRYLATVALIGGLLIIFFIFGFMITQPFVITDREKLIYTVSPKDLKKHVRLLSEKFPRRHAADNLLVTAAYIEKQFRKTGGKVSIQRYTVEGESYRNVSVVFGPDTKERVVVGAHYDTFNGLPGADDNASGVAGLIELAKLLGRTRLNKNVELVAYSTEEPPYFRSDQMGSAFHARKLKQQGVKVKLMVALETIGYFSDIPGSQQYPMALLRLYYPDTANFIAIVSKFSHFGSVRRMKKAMRKATDLPVYSINAPAFIPGIDFSDHLNYWRQGYPAVMVTDTAFYRNSRYHTKHDTFDTLDYVRMAKVVNGLYAAVLAFSRD